MDAPLTYSQQSKHFNDNVITKLAEHILRALHLYSASICIVALQYERIMQSLVDDHYLHVHTMLRCTHEQKAQGVQLIGIANKNAVLRRSWTIPNN